MADYKPLDRIVDRVFESALRKVEGRFRFVRKDPGAGVKLLSCFTSLRKYQRVYVHKVTEFRSETGSFVVLLAEKHLTIEKFKRSERREEEIEEIEPMVVFGTATPIGRVLIRHETLADKFADLIHKIDVDFDEYPTFSRNYLVIGEKRDVVRAHLPVPLIEALDKVKGMTVEIEGKRGLIRPERNLTEPLLLQLLGIGHHITK